MLSSEPRRPIENPLQDAPDPMDVPRGDAVAHPAIGRDGHRSARLEQFIGAAKGHPAASRLDPIADARRAYRLLPPRGRDRCRRHGCRLPGALDTKLERLVALKLLPPDQAADGEVVRRFYQEGRSAAQLDHENIARVYSIGQDGYLHYIAFEYIEGETIRQRVEQSGPLPVPEAIDIALQIAQALVHASQRGVVHRDIKPSNIILTPQGRAKLVDMGLATASSERQRPWTDPDRHDAGHVRLHQPRTGA